MSEINMGVDPGPPRQVAAGIDEVPRRSSAVSWAAIFAGAACAAALSLLLLILGTGLGFSAVSPWAMEGIRATTFGFAAIAWLSFTQLAASGMGGYLAGRLRSTWPGVHPDEVYFRDTAHGFLAWAVASLLTAVVLTSVVGSIIGGGVRAGAATVGTATGSAATLAVVGNGSGEVSDTVEYFVDSLFRSNSDAPVSREVRQETQPERIGNAQSGEEGPAPQANAEQREPPPTARQTREPARSEVAEIPAGEITRIFMRALRTGTLPQEDERYIARLIAQRTDLNQQDAEQRVSEGFEQARSMLEDAETAARETADEARKASAYGALWMFVTLLIGAFAASLMAVFGGRQRDA